VIVNASYLEEVYQVDFFEAYQIAKRHMGKTREQLCDAYFEEMANKKKLLRKGMKGLKMAL